MCGQISQIGYNKALSNKRLLSTDFLNRTPSSYYKRLMIHLQIFKIFNSINLVMARRNMKLINLFTYYLQYGV